MLQIIWLLWPKRPPYRERENKVWNQERENGFSLGRNARKRREQGSAAFEKTQREYVQKQRKRKPHKKDKEEKAANRESLREKKTAKRELCVEKKIKKREQSVAAFERDN